MIERTYSRPERGIFLEAEMVIHDLENENTTE